MVLLVIMQPIFCHQKWVKHPFLMTKKYIVIVKCERIQMVTFSSDPGMIGRPSVYSRAIRQYPGCSWYHCPSALHRMTIPDPTSLKPVSQAKTTTSSQEKGPAEALPTDSLPSVILTALFTLGVGQEIVPGSRKCWRCGYR